MLALTIGARRVLEIGTLAGCSATRRLARANLERAGLADRVEILVGGALDTLAQLAEREHEPFDRVRPTRAS